MNCPNCGRPLNDRQNICPRCKTHIYHNDGSEEKAENKSTGAASGIDMASRTEKKKGSAFKTIIYIILILILIPAILILVNILTNGAIATWAEKFTWLEWFANLLNMIKI